MILWLKQELVRGAGATWSAYLPLLPWVLPWTANSSFACGRGFQTPGPLGNLQMPSPRSPPLHFYSICFHLLSVDFTQGRKSSLLPSVLGLISMSSGALGTSPPWSSPALH